MAGCSTKSLGRPPTMLEQLLEEINFQRTKEMRQLIKDDSGFVMLHGTTYWTDLFVRHFLFQAEHTIDGDDLLFFVRKKHIKSSSKFLPKFETEVDVFRKDSKKLPIGDPDIDWEETVYLNLVVHQFDYTLTLAICTRTSPKELQVLRRHSQKVYASPSRRRMDAKGELEEMTYPHICFMVDNFDEVFCDILVRDGEMVCVELVASDREGTIQGVIFLGSIRYDALKKVYDARSSLSTKMAQRMTFGLFSGAGSQRVEFVRMKGPQGKGHAEMAVTKPKGSGAETPTSEPGYCVTDALWDAEWDDAEEMFLCRHQRRLSDPSSNLNNFARGGWRTKPGDSAGSKARSENEGLDSMANGLNEIEAGDVKDGDDDEAYDQEIKACQNLQQHQQRRQRRASGQYWSAQSSPVLRSRFSHESPRHRCNAATNRLAAARRECNTKIITAGLQPRGPSRQNSVNGDHHRQEAGVIQPQTIEVGSETLPASSGSSPTDDDVVVRQKIDSNAIIVNGREELPLQQDESSSVAASPVASGDPTPASLFQYYHQQNNRHQQRNHHHHRYPHHHQHSSSSSPRGERHTRPGRSRSLATGGCDKIMSSSYTSSSNYDKDDIFNTSTTKLNGNNDHNETTTTTTPTTITPTRSERSATLPRQRRRRAFSGPIGATNPLPPHRVTPDGTAIYYWCELPRRNGSQELDDGAYNPLWTMRGFTQTFHFWKENKRAQSVPLNAFLTYITLPWWSIAKDILDHREGPILTF
ncbi:unnamed protein product [Trichogramma brassicae]|uniref:Uncharacterized protein n=1 Tax=Trichogramma brassicae TaxID=86971 RepID=A0A6H5I9C5_9HYME|nr:unnamed protein product [Trichogramma brassicae]